MKKTIILSLALLATSSPEAAVIDRALAPFDTIEASVPFDVVWQAANSPRLHVEGDADLLDRLEIDSTAGMLKLKLKKSVFNWHWSDRQTVRISVGSPALKQVSLSGSGDLKVQGARGKEFTVFMKGSGDMLLADVQVGILNVELVGSGDLTATGAVDGVSAKLRGSGDIRFGNLNAKMVGATLAGSGDLKLWASEKAILRCSGSGDITVGGAPKVRDLQRSGSCDIHFQ